jgi:hypothetical protein
VRKGEQVNSILSDIASGRAAKIMMERQKVSDKTWKARERLTAKRVGGQRNQVGTGLPDVTSNWLVVEQKHREKLPNWISADLQKARAAADGNQLGIVLLHEKGRHDEVVMLSRKDFEKWFGWERPMTDKEMRG